VKWRHSNLWSRCDLHVVGQHGVQFVWSGTSVKFYSSRLSLAGVQPPFKSCGNLGAKGTEARRQKCWERDAEDVEGSRECGGGIPSQPTRRSAGASWAPSGVRGAAPAEIIVLNFQSKLESVNHFHHSVCYKVHNTAFFPNHDCQKLGGTIASWSPTGPQRKSWGPVPSSPVVVAPKGEGEGAHAPSQKYGLTAFHTKFRWM